ncbi:hypothetical protein GCM10009727_83200 [Actinomadura napierensis]|uniref:Uncharacterized protein n=1 Tax=Actinomadura napierensis TaxID=267854 RepID=A0ABN3AGB5_9ACTN
MAIVHRDLHRAVVERGRVPPHLRSSAAHWPTYRPVNITPPELRDREGLAASVAAGWAEPATDPAALPDLAERRADALIPLEVDADGRPLNPTGRTGRCGRDLGRWGENAAADAIVVAGTGAARRVLLMDGGSLPGARDLPVVTAALYSATHAGWCHGLARAPANPRGTPHARCPPTPVSTGCADRHRGDHSAHCRSDRRPGHRHRPGRPRLGLLAVLPAVARPELPAGRLQPRRHPVHHRLHDLHVRVDGDGAPADLLHQSAEGQADRRVRLLRHQHLRLRRRPPGAARARRRPKATTNLWPEPRYGTQTATSKDGVETKLKNAVCKGSITLASARSTIARNWTTALAVTGIG